MACSYLTGCTAHQQAAQAEVMQLLQQQAQAWNRGDIDAFMGPYWNSPLLSFSSDGTTRWGWTQTRQRYLQRYPTPERMGKLAFSDLHTRSLGATAILVLGRWYLERTPDPVGGNFSLIFQKRAGRWMIVHDHTSQAEPSHGPSAGQ